jgi:hypothetical protein
MAGQSGDKGVYDKENDSLGLGEHTSGSGGGSLSSKVDETIGQHSSKEAGESESNALNSLNQGITGIGDKLGKGFTGAAGGAAGAAGTVFKSDNAFAGAGGKFKLAGAIGKSVIKNRKGLFAGVGLGGGLIGILSVFLLGSLPFGFNSVMNGVVDKEMKVVEGNVGQMQDNLASYYIKKYLLPGMKLNGCTGTIVDKSCAVAATGSTPVSRMFRAWQKGNIEKKWAKQGFEIRYDKSAKRYFIRATGQGDIDITKYTNTSDDLFHEIGKSDVRALFQESHKNSTKWDRMLQRFGWGKKTIKLNYGVTRCNFTCKVLDGKDKYFTEPIATKKQAFKIKLFQKVLVPKSEMYSLAFTCLFAGSECDPNKPNINPETGEYRTQFDSDIAAKMQELRVTEVGSIKLSEAQTAVKELQAKGLERYLIETITKSLLGKVGAGEAIQQTAAKFAGLSVPGVNLVLAVAGAISTLHTIGPVLKSTNSSVQKAAAARQYSMNLTEKGEIESGNVDATEVGAFNTAFAPGQEKQEDGKMGGAGAGAVPLYNAVVNDGAQTQTAFLNGLFGAKTYAAANDPEHTAAYKCPVTGKILDPSGKDGQLVCPEQSLKYATFIASGFGGISNFLNLPGISVITTIADAITGFVGTIKGVISGPVVKLVQGIPGYDGMLASISSAGEEILKSFAKYFYPNWQTDNQSGATNFVATDFGGRVVANDYAENVLRGQPLTPQQVATIEGDADAMEEIQFKNKSLYARMFDKEDTHSFVTRLSLAMPTDFRSNMGSVFTGLISDPFGKLFRGFGAVFSGQTAFAAPKVLADPFGLTHYGFTNGNAVFHDDPETYQTSHCDGNDHSTAWNEHVTLNDDTGIMEHQQADPCGILEEGVESGGGLYDSSLVGL